MGFFFLSAGRLIRVIDESWIGILIGREGCLWDQVVEKAGCYCLLVVSWRWRGSGVFCLVWLKDVEHSEEKSIWLIMDSIGTCSFEVPFSLQSLQATSHLTGDESPPFSLAEKSIGGRDPRLEVPL